MLSCLDASGNPLSFAIVLYQSETAKLNLWMPSHFPLLTESITRLAASANRVPDCRNSTHNLAKYSLSHSASNISEKLHFFHFNGLSNILSFQSSVSSLPRAAAII